MCLCVSLSVYAYLQLPKKPEEGAGSSEAGVAGKFELPDMGARNLTGAFHKSHKYL